LAFLKKKRKEKKLSKKLVGISTSALWDNGGMKM
jgi:hypothetical protein